MRFVPYPAPILRDYRRALFVRETRTLGPIVQDLAFKRGLKRRGPWLGASRSSPNQLWLPKLYVCVRAAHYWAVVRRILIDSRFRRYGWKFYSPLDNLFYERPDKIAFYCPSRRAIKTLISYLRHTLKGSAYHPLRHAARTSRYGLELVGSRGLYVGLDPLFLKGVSWRSYRALAISWAKVNPDHLEGLPGGSAGWLRRMNLTLSHEGPRTLTPQDSDIPFIRRYWRMIQPG